MCFVQISETPANKRGTVVENSDISKYETVHIINQRHKVYIVRHKESGRCFVMKILDVYNIDIYRQFKDHPIIGVPRVFDFFESDGHLTVIEEFISGCSLKDKIERADLTESSISHYMSELCMITGQIHSFRPPVIHRDIKPSNVMITDHDDVVLIDFNAAKYYSSDSPEDTVLLGTPGYAAPEQYGFGASSPQTDIYAMGVLLKEMVYVLKFVPERYTQIINRCMMLEPSERYADDNELYAAICNRKMSVKTRIREFCRRFALPGFRTGTPWKMITASICYVLGIYMLTCIKTTNPGSNELVSRIMMGMLFLAIVLCTCDYMGIKSIIPLCRYKNPVARVTGVILLNLMVCVAIMVIFFILFP